MRKLLFKRRPSVPAVRKWCKLGPVIDFVLPLVLVHSLLGKCFDTLKAEVPAPAAADDEPEAGSLDMDSALKSEEDFAKVQGARFEASKALLTATDTPQRLAILAECLEPLRRLTAWWMRRARASDFRGRGFMLDMIYAPFSQVQFAAQYVGTLMSDFAVGLALAPVRRLLQYSLQEEAGRRAFLPPCVARDDRQHLPPASLRLP